MKLGLSDFRRASLLLQDIGICSFLGFLSLPFAFQLGFITYTGCGASGVMCIILSASGARCASSQAQDVSCWRGFALTVSSYSLDFWHGFLAAWISWSRVRTLWLPGHLYSYLARCVECLWILCSAQSGSPDSVLCWRCMDSGVNGSSALRQFVISPCWFFSIEFGVFSLTLAAVLLV